MCCASSWVSCKDVPVDRGQNITLHAQLAGKHLAAWLTKWGQAHLRVSVGRASHVCKCATSACKPAMFACLAPAPACLLATSGHDPKIHESESCSSIIRAGIGASVWLADLVYNVPANVILDSVRRALTTYDVLTSMAKSWVFGTVVATVC